MLLNVKNSNKAAKKLYENFNFQEKRRMKEGMLLIRAPDAPEEIDDTLVWLKPSELSNPAYKDFFTEAVKQFDGESYESLLQDKWPAEVLLITGKGMLRVVSHMLSIAVASSVVKHRCYSIAFFVIVLS